jgi:hypothetical protein
MDELSVGQVLNAVDLALKPVVPGVSRASGALR